LFVVYLEKTGDYFQSYVDINGDIFMKQKILAMTIAAALASPAVTYADVKLSGTIQGEFGAAQSGKDGAGEDVDRLRVSKDNEGALTNGGPNHLRFDFDEKLGEGGLSAYARYQVSFNTAYNRASGTGTGGLTHGQEAWLGLKSAFAGGGYAYGRFGTVQGMYKELRGLVDPFAGTSLQARGTAGGMSGSTRLGPTLVTGVEQKASPGDKYLDKDGKEQVAKGGETIYIRNTDKDGNAIPGVTAAKGCGQIYVLAENRYHCYVVRGNALNPAGGTISESTKDHDLAHSGWLENVLELGVADLSGLSLSLQGVYDETADMDGAGIVTLKYAMGDAKDPMLVIFASGSYLDLKNATNTVTNRLGSSDEVDNTGRNWKVGALYNLKMGANSLKIAAQYEDAELGAMDNNPSGGKYIFGSVDFRSGDLAVGAWVGSYSSDLDENERLFSVTSPYTSSDIEKGTLVSGELLGEDALSWAVGIKYFFSKRNLFFGGYRQVDSDNDYRDENVFGVGLRHTF
jgi:hypothetical protein